MDAFQSLSSLTCELRIITAKNIEFIKPTRNLFVRCYLSAGNNQRVKLDSQEISPRSNFFWNESFSLDCFGLSKDSTNMLMEQGSVVFELRCRNIVPVFGRLGKSQLLGRAEVPWKSVIESPNMDIEKWVVMVPKKGGLHKDIKPPSIQIGMKIEAPVAAEEAARRQRRRNNGLRKWDECGCSSYHGGCQSCQDYEVFALGVALEAF